MRGRKKPKTLGRSTSAEAQSRAVRLALGLWFGSEAGLQGGIGVNRRRPAQQPAQTDGAHDQLNASAQESRPHRAAMARLQRGSS